MKKNFKIGFWSLLLFGVFGQFTLLAQTLKTCDIAIGFKSPINNEIIPFGDTAKVSLYFVNNGPDTLLQSDTIFYEVGGLLAACPSQNLNIGDSIILPISTVYSTGGGNDTIQFEANLTNTSATFFQTNPNDDSTSVTFIMNGNGQTGLSSYCKSINELNLFPNPASGLVTIQLNTARYKKVQLSVTDIYGRETLFHDYLNSNKSGIQFDVAGFQPGIYFVQLTADAQIFTSKLVVR